MVYLDIMVLNEQQTFVPQPRFPHLESDTVSFHRQIREFGALICKGPGVMGNGPVYAMPADASRADTAERIEEIKGEARKGRPLALTIPFESFLSQVNTSYIKDSRLQNLLQNPSLATYRFGGWAFIRMAASRAARHEMPECVVSKENGTIQNFSPVGHATALKFLGSATRAGVRLPVMTSANPSRKPEYVDEQAAQEFAKEHNLPFLPNTPSWAERSKPKGSYPVLEVTAGSLKVVRQGFLSRELIEGLLSDLPVEWPEEVKESNYPDSILTLHDLSAPERSLRGAELRRAVLHHVIYGTPGTM